MKRYIKISLMAIVCLVMFAVVQLGMVKETAALDEPPDPACWVTTGAFSGEKNLKDHFTGQAVPTVADNSGPAVGCWRHTTAAGDVFVGNVHTLLCFRDGGNPPGGGVFSNLVIMVADGTWNDMNGYRARIDTWDHGEPAVGEDDYAIVITNSTGEAIYFLPKSRIGGGNIQIHALNEPRSKGIGSCGE